MRRRTLLRRGAVLAALGLAGCAGTPTDDATPEPSPSPVDAGSPTPTATTSPTPEPTATQPDEATTTERPTASPSPSSTDTATPTEIPSPTATEAASPTPTATPTPDQKVVVAPGGSLSFDPASFQIAVGDSVLWTWDAGGHNVKASATPEGSDWSGTPGGEFDTFGSSYTYRYTFEVAGTYEYYCAPHRSAGMTGSFTVG